MRIPTRIHGMLDYLEGLLLIAAPWILGFARGGAETWSAVGVGAAILLYSLLTDYEFGAVRKIPVYVHLWLDAIGAVFLIASPWLLGFDEITWTPHTTAGALILLLAGLTLTVPGYERRRAPR